MNKIWYDKAWDDFLYWQMTDRKIFRKICELLKCIDRGNTRVGKAEILKDMDGFCSMHITDKHRLVYRIKDGQLEIASCKSHYDDK